MAEITLNVNGETRTLDVDPATPLIYVLRNQFGLTGTKLGCGLEQCGACAVLVDGAEQLSCNVAAADFEGKKIVTVEGLAEGGRLNRVQQAFLDAGAAQCGYCTPGLVVAVTALLDANPKPDRAAMMESLDAHLCRCGSHGRVMAAIRSLTGEAA